MSAVQPDQCQKRVVAKPKRTRLFALIVGVLLVVCLIVISRPYRYSLEKRAENDLLQREVFRLNEEARQYKREISALDTVQGRILLGRRTGLVGEGESRLNIPDK